MGLRNPATIAAACADSSPDATLSNNSGLSRFNLRFRYVVEVPPLGCSGFMFWLRFTLSTLTKAFELIGFGCYRSLALGLPVLCPFL